MQWPQTSDLEPGAWVRVVGRLVLAEFIGESIPAIAAESISSVPEPARALLLDERVKLHD